MTSPSSEKVRIPSHKFCLYDRGPEYRAIKAFKTSVKKYRLNKG